MSWLDSIFLGDELERGTELDAKIRALNQAKFEKGVLDAGQLEKANANLEKESAAVHSAQIGEDFSAGLSEGYDNVTGAIKTTLSAPFKFAWDSIPWQLLVVGLLAGAWYLGLFNGLKNKFAK